MAGNKQVAKSRVVKINSEEAWEFYVTHATNLGCPVVVHFTASWCVPSVAMNPFFQQIAFKYQDILFLSLDVDEVKGVTENMKIKAMPTFLMMRGGAEVGRVVGANPEEIRKIIHSFHYVVPGGKMYN